MKSSGKLRNISGKRSWEVVCNHNQTVKVHLNKMKQRQRIDSEAVSFPEYNLSTRSHYQMI